jgi:hypothetical protein
MQNATKHNMLRFPLGHLLIPCKAALATVFSFITGQLWLPSRCSDPSKQQWSLKQASVCVVCTNLRNGSTHLNTLLEVHKALVLQSQGIKLTFSQV